MSTLAVEVTADDITHGLRQHCERCPIARALSRLFPDKGVEVFYSQASVYDVDSYGSAFNYRHFELPRHATEFIESFDASETVIPQRFELTELAF